MARRPERTRLACATITERGHGRTQSSNNGGRGEVVTGRPQPRPPWTPPDASREHLLVSYDTDAAFVTAAVQCLAPALEEGDAAVVIIDRDHRRELMAALAGHGLDVEGAVRAEQLLSLDAAALLSACTTGDGPDLDRLMHIILQAVARGAAGAREVHLLSELASLLWQRGKHLAAVSVEGAGTGLVESWPLSLLCPYPNSFAVLDRGPGFTAICDQHTSLLHARDDT